MVPKLLGCDIELGNFVLGVDWPRGTGAAASRALLREIDGFPRTTQPGARWGAPIGGHAHPTHAGTNWNGSAAGYCHPTRSATNWNGSTGEYSHPNPTGTNWSHSTDGYSDASYPVPGAAAQVSSVQDWGRRFLASGGCAYVDLDHLECCTSETLSAYDQVACIHAMLRVAARALAAANARLPERVRIQALVNNSDGRGSSYGSHTNVLLSRPALRNLFDRRLQYLLYLASFQCSSIVFTGQGKVGSENGAPDVRFQLSQRADFFETITGVQTTSNRPIVNARDEALCGIDDPRVADAAAGRLARLHVIFFDSTLCHVATLLRLGTLQLIAHAIEAERVDPALILDDPLDAVLRWSHDPTLQSRARLVDGRHVTAVEHQLLFVEAIEKISAEDGCEETVPHAREIVALWQRTLEQLRARDFDGLTGQLDWVLKKTILERALRQRPALTWDAPPMKHLDLLYASLDPEEGLYWAYEREGLTNQVVSDERIAWLMDHPPEDTRAWTRGMLLGRAGADRVEAANWDSLRIATTGIWGWPLPRTIDLADPLAWNKATTEGAFEDGIALDETLDRLQALAPRPANTTHSQGGSEHDAHRTTTRHTRLDATGPAWG